MNRFCCAALLSIFLLAATPDLPPTFTQFPATLAAAKSAIPVLRTQEQRTFRTVIRDAAQHGTNFAGHYTLAKWGCGTGCVSIAIVNNETGQTFDGPFPVLVFDPGYRYERGDELLEFRPDSTLLIARGCPRETDCATYYYVWKVDRFERIRKTAATLRND